MQLDLPKGRNLFFSDQVDQKTILELSKAIIEINEADEHLERMYAVHKLIYEPAPIKIFIDSFGGSVYQILGLIGIIEKSKVPVHTIVTGVAMSAGFMLLICGHQRFAYEHSTILYHMLSDRMAGNIQALKEEMIENERLQGILEGIVLRRTDIPVKKLLKVRNTKIDWYIDTKQALKLKCIDQVIL